MNEDPDDDYTFMSDDDETVSPRHTSNDEDDEQQHRDDSEDDQNNQRDTGAGPSVESENNLWNDTHVSWRTGGGVRPGSKRPTKRKKIVKRKQSAGDKFESAVEVAASSMDNADVEEFEEIVSPTNPGEDRSQSTCNRKACWGCQFGATQHPGDVDSDQMRQLVMLIRNNHGRMANRELAKMIARHHEHNIRRPMRRAGLPCIEWPVAMVLEHLLHHTLDPAIVFAESIQSMRALARTLRRRTMETDLDTGETRVDPKNVDLLLKTFRGIAEMYSRRPNEMMFGIAASATTGSDYLINAPSTDGAPSAPGRGG